VIKSKNVMPVNNHHATYIFQRGGTDRQALIFCEVKQRYIMLQGLKICLS